MKLQGAGRTLHVNQTRRLCIRAVEISGANSCSTPVLGVIFGCELLKCTVMVQFIINNI